MARERYRLSPDRTPMENLWGCIRQAVEVYYRSVPYSVRMTRDELDEFFGDLYVRVFVRFRSLVWRGKYKRQYTLWNNIWGCVWSVWQDTLDYYYNIIRHKIDGQCDYMHNIGFHDIIHHDTSPRLNDQKDTRQFHNAKYAIEKIKGAYVDYCADMEEDVLTPVPLLDFVRINYPEHWADFLEDMRGERAATKWGKHRPAQAKKKEPPKVETPTTEQLYEDAGLEAPRVYVWDRLNPWD